MVSVCLAGALPAQLRSDGEEFRTCVKDDCGFLLLWRPDVNLTHVADIVFVDERKLELIFSLEEFGRFLFAILNLISQFLVFFVYSGLFLHSTELAKIFDVQRRFFDQILVLLFRHRMLFLTS